MIPKDINMLISFINTKLRDDDMSLSNLLDVIEMSSEDFNKRLEEAGFYFDESINQIKLK